MSRYSERPGAGARILVAGAALALICGWAGGGRCGPLRDPFLEEFQVGMWPRAEDVDLVAGLPAGILRPAQVDTAWIRAAGLVLTPTPAGSVNAVGTLLRGIYPAGADSVWRRQAGRALRDLLRGRPGALNQRFLLTERLANAFFARLAVGDTAAAAGAARLLLAKGDDAGLSARQRLAWHLRLARIRPQDGTAPAAADSLWPGFTELGPFDTVNAWALWAACRKAQNLPLVPRDGDQEQLAQVLSSLPVGTLAPGDLATSRLPRDWRAALGAILLPRVDLAAHFKKYSQPPPGFAKQGLWVRGQRRWLRGAAASYERLAARESLRPGWRMDLWRRASEVRVLKGAWVEGLQDLRQAVDLAAQGRGTRALRKRLRQWVEQAMVLALAHDDLRTAREVRDLGLAQFRAAQRDAFAAAIAHWQDRLSGGRTPVPPPGPDSVDQARRRVRTGAVPDLRGATPEIRGEFRAAAAAPLWPLWRQWGLALANPTRVAGERRVRAERYRDFLAHLSDDAPPAAVADSALVLAGRRLRHLPGVERLLRAALDVDCRRRLGGPRAPEPSPVPPLLPAVRGSELDRHALLGFCLAIGDMRGTLGLAYELPGRGLTRDQKRLFLYPLPAAGAIRSAVEAATSEPALLLAIARNESLFESAIRSRAGALGWMQIMPFHYPGKGAADGPDNWRIPAVSVGRGDDLLAAGRARFEGDPYRTVAAYNAGPGAAGRWDRQLGSDATRAEYLAWIGYPETRSYVEKVLIDREIYTEIIRARQGAPGPESGSGAANE